LSREEQLVKLRKEVEELDAEFKKRKGEFDAKEKLQNEAFNVSFHVFILHVNGSKKLTT
jgi:hypothetical protein